MKKAVILFAFLYLTGLAYGQGMKQIADIKINTAELANTCKYISTQFIFKSNDKTLFYNCFDVIDFIELYIKDIPQKERKELIFIAENSKGEKSVATIADFDPKFSLMPAMMVYTDVKRQSTSKMEIVIKGGDNDKINEKELESTFHMAVQNRKHLQMKSMSKADKEQYFKDASLLFLTDINPTRWITGVTSIKIFRP